MGGFIENVGSRSAGFVVEKVAGTYGQFDIRRGRGWFGEVTQHGGSESLRWASGINLSTHDTAVNDVAAIILGNPNLLSNSSPVNLTVKVFTEIDRMYGEPHEFDFSNKNGHAEEVLEAYVVARDECLTVSDGRKVEIEHYFKSNRDNFIFSFTTTMHPPHDVSMVTLRIADEYAEKWDAVTDWITARHANRVRFGI